MIAEQFLGPTADLVDVAGVIEDFFHGAAITKPEKMGAPEVFAKLADGPTAASGFADEGVEVAFAFSTTARAKANGS